MDDEVIFVVANVECLETTLKYEQVEFLGQTNEGGVIATVEESG